MKRLILIISLTIGLVAGTPGLASAHVLRKDGDISAELHIEPYDHPIAGQKTTYEIHFEDEPAAFKLSDYDTRIDIIDEMDPGKVISTKKLTETEAGESKNTYTFSMAMAYTIRVTGTAQQQDIQQKFTLSFPVDVKAAANDKNTEVNPAVWVIGGVAVVAIIAAAIVMERNGKPKEPQQP